MRRGLVLSLSALPVVVALHGLAQPSFTVRPLVRRVSGLQLVDDPTTAASVTPAPPAVQLDVEMGVVTPVARTDAVPSIPESEYQRGLATVGFITLLFASNSPALRCAFTAVEHVPPVLLVSAIASVTALSSLLIGGPLLSSVPTPSTLDADATDAIDATSMRAGAELGLWKTLGTSFNLYGLSLTSADHGAFLIQLTTLLVPVAQGVQGVPIPRRIWLAVAIALIGLALFTADPGGPGGMATASSLEGDAACVAAACCYALYDLRLFVWGKRVTPLRLIQNKVRVRVQRPRRRPCPCAHVYVRMCPAVCTPMFMPTSMKTTAHPCALAPVAGSSGASWPGGATMEDPTRVQLVGS